MSELGDRERLLRYRLAVLAILIPLGTLAIGVLYPSLSSSPPRSMLAWISIHSWILLQSLILISPGLLVAWLLRRRLPRVGFGVGFGWMILVPAGVLCDAIAFGWISDRFLSAKILRVATDLRDSLLAHAQWKSIASPMLWFLGFAVTVIAVFWISSAISRLCVRHQTVAKWSGGIVGVCVCLFSLPAILDWQTTASRMRATSTRHPWVVFRIIDSSDAAASSSKSRFAPVAFMIPQDGIQRRSVQQRVAGLNWDALATHDEPFPDVVVVVLESFRHEMVDAETMPNLTRLASDGIHCRNHFSAANASNMGMFSLVNGLEAIWFDEPIRYSPLMNRLFHQASYELGLFASHDDWRLFAMDGFLNEQQFDVFQCEPKGWSEVDRRTVSRATAFLNRSDLADASSPPPRLAVVYLYTTHADYRCDPADEWFHPAADDSFPIPYRPELRNAVWNRYKNCARTVDRLIRPLLDRNRVVIVTGDHGEAFLEDGTCGHGTKLSRYQTMTPAIIFAPGITPKQIDQPTIHADLLPTLIELAGLPISDPSVFDGSPIASKSKLNNSRWKERVFMVRDYLSDEALLVGPPTASMQSESILGIGCRVSLDENWVRITNAISESGDRVTDISDFEDASNKKINSQILQEWLKKRFDRG
ncbi:sulfatase-like hydrolase/transferase [Novipirellula caenicola]|uniref:Sulfatase N-terminal domain-containing protein n=1 Tax=Novipirellula caenicola TaxID=1536901 RepID=A0ABP9VTA5_9BACT